MADISSLPSDPSSLLEAFERARRRIAKASRAAGRSTDGVVLTAVTKTQGDAAVEAALALGQRVFGENRVQEAQGRWSARRAAVADLELRLIGPLQSNKARDALALFQVIETLDREKLAEALAEAGQRLGVRPRVLIQINTGEEPQKAGAAPRDAEALIARARALDLAVEGLMCIPPVAEAAGPHFALLARIAERQGLSTLSMGMSEDYETAIRFGATHVRLGSALFGARPSPNVG